MIPDISIRANNPPIKPPLSLKRLVFIRSINKMKIVDLSEAIFNKVNGEKGLINIFLREIYLP